MEVALKTGTVDSQQLVYICAGSIGCMIVSMVLRIIRKGAQGRLSGEIRRCTVRLELRKCYEPVQHLIFSRSTSRLRARHDVLNRRPDMYRNDIFVE